MPVRRSVLSVNLDAVQAEFDGHRYAGTRSSLLITPSAHRAFHLAFEHIRRLSREDLQIINAAIRRNVKLHPYRPFNAQRLSARRIDG